MLTYCVRWEEEIKMPMMAFPLLWVWTNTQFESRAHASSNNDLLELTRECLSKHSPLHTFEKVHEIAFIIAPASSIKKSYVERKPNSLSRVELEHILHMLTFMPLLHAAEASWACSFASLFFSRECVIWIFIKFTFPTDNDDSRSSHEPKWWKRRKVFLLSSSYYILFWLFQRRSSATREREKREKLLVSRVIFPPAFSFGSFVSFFS